MNRNANRPIGYWLKEADRMITEAVNRAQADNGVSRTEWQVLHMLYEESSTSRASLTETLRSFIDAAGLDDIMIGLAERGWLDRGNLDAEGPSQLRITAEGRARHDVIAARQDEVRKRVMQGVSAEEYGTVIRVLQKIVTNLSEEAAQPSS